MPTGNQILARALREQGVENIFFIMGGPMIECENACEQEGIRMIDVRHEQAAVMMANAYARVTNHPVACMAASGPGVANLVTGIAHAFVDGAPLVAIGGSSPVEMYGMGAFQELDQVTLMKPITVWSERCYDTKRIPSMVNAAFRHALSGRPGPVYLDMPGPVINGEIAEEDVRWVKAEVHRVRPAANPAAIDQAIEVLARAERPIVISGSGILWSGASAELKQWVEAAGIPFYTTPQGRGVIPEDHSLCYLYARSTAFKEADCIMVIGTRLNYVIDFARPPRFNKGASFIQVDIEPMEIGKTRSVDAALMGDAKTVLTQLSVAAAGRIEPSRYADWVSHLREIDIDKQQKAEQQLSTSQVPIHPLRLCKEIRDFIDRDAIVTVDGQEILTYARQSISIFASGHSLNSGPFGTMGVGLPLGIGAKVAAPDKQVVVIHGDGSFGFNAMEIDTAVRHGIPILCVISNNGGWTAANKYKVGRDLGFTRYDLLAESLGGYGEFVEQPDQIRPALERAAKAVAGGTPAVVNVITDPQARASHTHFTAYET